MDDVLYLDETGIQASEHGLMKDRKTDGGKTHGKNSEPNGERKSDRNLKSKTDLETEISILTASFAALSLEH